MKKTRSSKVTEMASRWFKAKAQLKKLKAEVDECKDFFYAKLGDEEALSCGKFVVTSTAKSQTTVDRAKLTDALGIEGVAKYLKTTNFVQLDVKREAK